MLAAAKAVRQHAGLMLDAMVQDFERATGPWHAEWMAIPESFVLTAGALHQAKFALGGLIVDEKRMAENLDISRGLIVAEAVMMGLAPAYRPAGGARRRLRRLPRRQRKGHDACGCAVGGSAGLQRASIARRSIALTSPKIISALRPRWWIACWRRRSAELIAGTSSIAAPDEEAKCPADATPPVPSLPFD